jgi:hypothetical protein
MKSQRTGMWRPALLHKASPSGFSDRMNSWFASTEYAVATMTFFARQAECSAW